MANAYFLDMNGNYFPNEDGLSDNYYADTNQVVTQGTQLVAGVGIYQKGNRVAPQIWAVNEDGSGGSWIRGPQGNDSNYFPSQGGLSETYADTNAVMCPDSKVIRGIQFYQKGNRIAIQIQCTDPNGANPQWIKGSQENDQNYFPARGGLSSIFADTNPLVLLKTNRVRGVAFWEKSNRLAFSVFV